MVLRVRIDKELSENLGNLRGVWFDRFPCCKAYLNGHRHSGGYELQGGLHYLTLNGMLEMKDNAFSCARLYRSHLEIRGFGRQPSRTLQFR